MTSDSVWKQAARYGDADAEEHGLEEAIRKQGIDFEEYRHLADQRALRNVLMRRPGFDPAALDQPSLVVLNPMEKTAHVAFMAAYWDGLYIGWRARGLDMAIEEAVNAGEDEGEYVGEHTDTTFATKIAKQDADDARRQYEVWGGSIVRRWEAGEITADEGLRDLRKLLEEEREIREQEERERNA
jgi:hypothetical protein